MANPMGRYFRGRRHLMFVHSPELLGFASWGRPVVEDVRELLFMCRLGLREGLAPLRWLVDLRGLEFIGPATFAMFLEFTRTHREVLGRCIFRQAQLRPEGVVGAVISGFSQLARLPYPERVFGDVDEALAWLEVDSEAGRSLVAELGEIRSDACERHEMVARLRRVLASGPPMSVASAARRLAVSTRSLQRALRQAGTTYRIEVTAQRVRRAQELLGAGEQNLAWIASEVGFSSVEHLATAYRRAVGNAPQGLRAAAPGRVR